MLMRVHSNERSCGCDYVFTTSPLNLLFTGCSICLNITFTSWCKYYSPIVG